MRLPLQEMRVDPRALVTCPGCGKMMMPSRLAVGPGGSMLCADSCVREAWDRHHRPPTDGDVDDEDLELLGLEPYHPDPMAGTTGDPVERFFTDPVLAERLVARMPSFPADTVYVEPSLGRADFVMSTRRRFGNVRMYGVDIDAQAPGWARIAPEDRFLTDLVQLHPQRMAALGPHRPTVAVGNPPFSLAVAHIQHLLALGLEHLFLLLPMGVLEAENGWPELLEVHPPEWVIAVRGRVFGDHCRCVGFFYFRDRPGRFHLSPHRIEGRDVARRYKLRARRRAQLTTEASR